MGILGKAVRAIPLGCAYASRGGPGSLLNPSVVKDDRLALLWEADHSISSRLYLNEPVGYLLIAFCSVGEGRFCDTRVLIKCL